MVLFCPVCNQRLLSHARKIKCTNCLNVYHIKCLSYNSDSAECWICTKCISDTMPFNHFIDDDHFFASVNSFFGSENVAQFNHIVFNPFEISEMDNLHDAMPMIENDPDLQFFNDIANLQNHTGIVNTMLRIHSMRI